MGLTMFVGLLEEDMDDEDRDVALEELGEINELLAEEGLPPHEEPEGDEEDEYWNFMIRYGSYERFQDYVRGLKERGEIALDDDALSHLLEHSGSDGYFAPVEFPRLLKKGHVEIGSCAKLREICAEAARHLQLPVPLDAIEIDYSGEGAELEEQLEDYRAQGGAWTHHGIETLICIVLYQGATVSLKSGKIMGFG